MREGPDQLPYLLKLLDDESQAVRNRVMEALVAFGPELSIHLDALPDPLNDEQRDAIEVVMTRQRKQWLRDQWPSWRRASGRKAQVETALSLLARFQLGLELPLTLGDLLDNLAGEYQRRHEQPDVFTLASFLFEEKRLRGNRNDYLNPLNSNLISVILSKRGIPISLVLIYMLVGARLDMDIEGCNVPRHFLARAIQDDRTVLVDCFERGRIVEIEKLMGSTATASRQLEMLRRGTSSVRIVQRVLQNLSHAYRRAGDGNLSAFMVELLGATARRDA